jgi:hypothetical protein
VTNPQVLRLDRHIRLHGEPVQLVRQIAGVQRHRLNLRAIIKTLGVQQIIGGITATSYQVVLSPTELRRKAYPGAIPATIPAGTGPVRDDMLPVASVSDVIIVRGQQKAIAQVDAIYDKGEVVRIELKVQG